MECPGDTSSARGFSAEKQAQQGEPKSPSLLTWTFSFVPQAQHHLTEGQHHFERSENIIPHEAAQMNDVAACRK